MSTPVVNILDRLSPERAVLPKAASWDDRWSLAGGTAWVYYSRPGQTKVRRPVILADGFAMGPSDPDVLWNGLENGRFPFVTKLREQGYDLVLLGFDERSASVIDNADTAIDCIKKTIANREGSASLTVGGFSMGGLVTRYALAKMGNEHQTSTYISYDTPHQGAWLPIAVQGFAHFVKEHWGSANELMRHFSTLVNSPAARQLLRWHIATPSATAGQDQARTDFITALEEVGYWPAGVRRFGVANGSGTGAGNGIPAGTPAMSSSGPVLGGTTLNTQATGAQTVARLQKAGSEPVLVRTDGLPDIDGAPGGLFPEAELLPGNFAIAAMLAMLLDGEPAQLAHPTSTFVPTISAVAAGDIDNRDALYSKIDPTNSELDDFLCADGNEGHTVMTERLGRWILDHLPTE
ncbi:MULTISPECIES: esterase/lipase family protein [unclassified Streptomyces]|uniref:esterase/lipase family protein n=1 Tax=unclassified Streptomyces TaxID=2593676 RepID=UPI002E333857|nr:MULTISPECIES: hypothetical protein [unclassified Streptomyces]WUC68987.1 hypothetical protein OG861_32535 [Streptomyces sp. NBC_00539]